MECSCKLWPIPGMYVVTSALLVSRARATLRNAELGFFGVWVKTRTHTPRFSGHPSNAGDFVFTRIFSRPLRTSCENVGTLSPYSQKLVRKNLFRKTRQKNFSRVFPRTANKPAQNSASE